MSEFYYASAGSGQIYARVWEPTCPVRGVLQIVHGIAEHVARYDDFARFLNSHGILVAAEDHMGHGKSLREGEVKGYFTGGWYAAVEDCRQLQRRLQEQYPGVPCFLLGHSMGSFLARTMLFEDDGLRAAIISGTGWQPAATLQMGLLLCRMEQKRLGETSTSKLLNKRMFGGYTKHCKPLRTKNDWICTDPDVVDRYTADPLCGFDATVGLSRDMLLGIRDIQKQENLLKMRKDLPVWFFSGAEDPVGNMGKGVQETAEAFRNAGMQQVSVTLYEGGRHEMLNEKQKDRVYSDVLSFLEPMLN